MILTIIGSLLIISSIVLIIVNYRKKQILDSNCSDINIKIDAANKIYESKIAAIEQINQNIKIEKENYFKCEEQLKGIHEQIDGVQERYHELINQNSLIQGRIEGAKKELETMTKVVKDNKEEIKNFKQNQQEIINSYEKDFQKRLLELTETYNEKTEEYEKRVKDLREKRNAAIQVAMQEEEKRIANKYYMLQITDNELEDIKWLKQIEHKLIRKDIIGKIIYKSYIEKHYTDLVGRVLNKEHFSGIYKITNQINQMCYIGQAADISTRWRQHIKRAVGAEPLTNNKLYPAMKEFGIENFTFEVVDKCNKDKLNEREQYWQEFYGAKTFGYSIK